MKDFIKEIEKVTNTPVTLIGTGERNCDIIDVRKEKMTRENGIQIEDNTN